MDLEEQGNGEQSCGYRRVKSIFGKGQKICHLPRLVLECSDICNTGLSLIKLETASEVSHRVLGSY